MALYADDNLAGNWSRFLYDSKVNMSCFNVNFILILHEFSNAYLGLA